MLFIIRITKLNLLIPLKQFDQPRLIKSFRTIDLVLIRLNKGFLKQLFCKHLFSTK